MGDLCSWRVLREGAVTEGVNLVATVQSQVLVDQQTSSCCLLFDNLGGQLFGQLTLSVTTGPDKGTVWNDHILGLTVWMAVCRVDVLVVNLLDHGVGLQVEALLLKNILSILDQPWVEHREDIVLGLNQGDAHLVLNSWDELAQVLEDVVLDFCCQLDTSWSTTADDKAQESLSVFGVLRQQPGRLDLIKELLSDGSGVVRFLKERRVLVDTRDAECVDGGADGINEVVVVQGGFDRLAVIGEGIADVESLGLVLDGDGLVFRIEVCRNGFEISDLAWGLSGNGSHRVADRLDVDCAARNGGKQRGEQKVVSWRHDGHVVLSGVQLVQEGDRPPAGAQDHDVLLPTAVFLELGLRQLTTRV